MSLAIEGTTLDVVGLALDAATLRQQALATNIANANTPGYRPLRVAFEEHLDALKNELHATGSLASGALDAYRPVLQTEPVPVDATGNSAVALDQEVAKLSANTLHYQVLLRALSRQLSIVGTAINEGKR